MTASTLSIRQGYSALSWASARAESRRAFVVRLVLLIYLLSLIEGPLRKWFLPEFSTPIYFLRDPFVLFLYAYSFAYGMFHRGGLAQSWLSFALVATVFGGVPFLLDGLDPLGWGLGARSYWLYMPLAFIVAANFRHQDFERFLRWNMLLAVPYAALVVAQYQASPFAWINRSLDSEATAIMAAAGIVRPYGLFTFTGPNVDFTASMVAMFVAFFLMRKRAAFSTQILLAGGAAVAVMFVLTGSRSIYFLVGSIIAVTIAGSTIARPTGRTFARNIGIALFIIFAAVVFVYVFDDMFMAMQTRFTTAAAIEGSIWGRGFGSLLRFIDPLMTAPFFFGYGIGTGTPAIAHLLGLPGFVYGEGELERVVNELGVILGMSFVLLRFGTAIWLVRAAILIGRRGDLSALPLVGYVLIPIAIGQITSSTLNGFQPWLVVGLILALRVNSRPAQRGHKGNSGGLGLVVERSRTEPIVVDRGAATRHRAN